jgi:8-oxo-dGTP diphosphatase
MPEKKIPRVGVAVFVFRSKEVLLGKRKGSHGTGMWAPPGGHLEFYETLEACGLRELAEETGLIARSIKTVGWSNDILDAEKHYITFYTVVDNFEGSLQLLEPHKCEEWRWFAKGQLPSPLFPTVKAFFLNC